MLIRLILGYKVYLLLFSFLLIGFLATLVLFRTNNLQQAHEYNEPHVNVEPTKKIVVDIQGAITNPGLYTVNQNTRVGELIKLAGGLLDASESFYLHKDLNLAKILSDSDKVYIPYEWEYYESTASVPLEVGEYHVRVQETTQEEKSEQAALVETANKTNVNTDNKEELEKLVGIGPAYATKIINSRPYTDYGELVAKSGIPSSTLSKISSDIEF